MTQPKVDLEDVASPATNKSPPEPFSHIQLRKMQQAPAIPPTKQTGGRFSVGRRPVAATEPIAPRQAGGLHSQGIHAGHCAQVDRVIPGVSLIKIEVTALAAMSRGERGHPTFRAKGPFRRHRGSPVLGCAADHARDAESGVMCEVASRQPMKTGDDDRNVSAGVTLVKMIDYIHLNPVRRNMAGQADRLTRPL